MPGGLRAPVDPRLDVGPRGDGPMSPLDTGAQRRLPLQVDRPREEYRLDAAKGRIFRVIEWGDSERTTSLPLPSERPAGLSRQDLWDWTWLRQSEAPPTGVSKEKSIRVADLFSGCGQMTIGVAEAARAVGSRAELVLAVDLDEDALEVCRRAFPSAHLRSSPIEQVLTGRWKSDPRPEEQAFIDKVGKVDVLVGGPPCQGHSDFNNHTRRDDGRNALALKMVRFAELTKPKHIVIENVRGIVHDRGGVLDKVRKRLENLKYRVGQRLLKGEEHGVAQRRWRMFMVATLDPSIDVEAVLDLPEIFPSRTFSWACGDLVDRAGTNPFDLAPVATATNQRRIDYLFENEEWELADSERPPCHRKGGHSYKSIYGRLWEDRPAQTITTGFRCMGQGRFVHPTRPRTITPHEAARLQFIPDFVDFSKLSPSSVAKLIGNAVPPKLLYGIALPLLARDAMG